MRFMHTPGGDEVVVMEAKEVLVMELALSLYVMEKSDSDLAVRMLVDASRANEEREAHMEDAVEAGLARP